MAWRLASRTWCWILLELLGPVESQAREWRASSTECHNDLVRRGEDLWGLGAHSCGWWHEQCDSGQYHQPGAINAEPGSQSRRACKEAISGIGYCSPEVAEVPCRCEEGFPGAADALSSGVQAASTALMDAQQKVKEAVMPDRSAEGGCSEIE